MRKVWLIGPVLIIGGIAAVAIKQHLDNEELYEARRAELVGKLNQGAALVNDGHSFRLSTHGAGIELIRLFCNRANLLEYGETPWIVEALDASHTEWFGCAEKNLRIEPPWR